MRQLRNVLELVPPPTSAGLEPKEQRPHEFRPHEFHPHEFRPLGAFENIFAAYCEEAVSTFTLVADLEGDITKTAVERALRQVQARHPLLAVGIRRDANERRVFVRSARPIPLKELPTGAVPWELAAGLELRRRFDVEEGPLMLASVRFEPKSVRMFFTFHPSIADGTSAAFVIQDFARALNGERLGTYIDAASLDRRLVSLPRAFPVCPEATGPTGVPRAVDRETLRRWGRGMSAIPIVSSRALPRDVTRRLREVARFHDATVHSALSVALARTIGEVRESEGNVSGRPVRLMSPINLRRMLGVKEECGLFVTAGLTALDPVGDSFWDEARKARAALEPYMNSDAVHNMIGGMMAFRENDDSPSGARAGFAAGFDFDAMLTNLGALPIKARHGRIRIKAIAGPIVLASVLDEHVVGAATLEDRLQLTYTSITPLPNLLERVEKKVVGACAAW
jgi:hypothetical protein